MILLPTFASADPATAAMTVGLMVSAAAALTPVERGRKLVERFLRLRDRNRARLEAMRQADALDAATRDEHDATAAASARIDHYEATVRPFARAEKSLARFVVKQTGAKLPAEKSFDQNEFDPAALRIDSHLVLVNIVEGGGGLSLDVQVVDVDAVPAIG